MSDPTIQSPLPLTPRAGETFAVSLAEIDAMGLKAARGCGYSWGLSQEAGRAARWLAAYGLAGPETLAALLDSEKHGLGEHAPKRDGERWFAAAGTLCPITLGASLSDRAELIAAGEMVRAEAVLFPLLLLPFLSRAARDLDCCFRLEMRDASLLATPDGPCCNDWDALSQIGQADIVLAAATTSTEDLRRHGWRAYSVPGAVWQDLGQWAHRTYVPASDASREAGAGAGRSDND